MNCVRSEILKQIFGFDTVKEAWSLSRSKGRIIQLKQNLLKMRKGNQNISYYILKFKELVYQLHYTLYGLTKYEKIIYLVFGFERDFEFIASMISSKMQSKKITLNDAIFFMLNHESWLETWSEFKENSLTSINDLQKIQYH